MTGAWRSRSSEEVRLLRDRLGVFSDRLDFRAVEKGV